MKISALVSILSDYGVKWAVFRGLYSSKLALLRIVPSFERVFERSVSVKRIDIFNHAIDFSAVQKFLIGLSQPEQSAIIENADKAAEGVIRAFSSIELDYGNPVQWFKNPINCGWVPSEEKWFTLPDFDEQFGDIKVFWEISRFSHALLLSRAALLTRDKKYYRAFSSQLRCWLEENHYSLGPNYKCGQENALRMFNVLIAYSAFSYLGMTDERATKDVTELVERSFRKIRSNFFYANKCIRNNHTLSELCGLVIGSWCCGEDALVQKYFSKLEREVLRQFLHDGGYIQWSFNYQRFALQLIEMAYSIQEVVRCSFSNEVRERVARSAQLLYQMQLPNGQLPNYGSNDGALIFPLSTCGFRDFRPVIACLSRQFRDGSPYDLGPWDEESVWFASAESLNKTAPVGRTSSAFNDAGLYTLRSENVLACVVLQDYKSHRPAHMDQLHVDISVGERNILSDGGTYSYASELGDQLVRTRSHNTLAPVGRDQMQKKGHFLLYGWTRRCEVQHSSRRFSGSFQSKANYYQERIVEANSEEAILITDTLIQSGAKSDVEILFHSPYIAMKNGAEVTFFDEGNRMGTLLFSDEGLIDLRIDSYEYSPLYFKKAIGTQIVACYTSESAARGVVTCFKYDVERK